jgi:PadR family transcriptional regulator PadR
MIEIIEKLVQWWDDRRRERDRRVYAVLLDPEYTYHHAYPLAKAARVRSGTLYPLLMRLENVGWLTSDWDAPDPRHPDGPRRRHYVVTPLGAAAMWYLLKRGQS